MNEKILKQLEAIKKLSEQGIDGEKDNAKILLKKLLKKYNLSENDITEQKEYEIDIGIRNNIFQELKTLISVKIIGLKNVKTYSSFRGNLKIKTIISFKTTKNIYNIILEMIDLYSSEYRKSLEIFNHAFIIKQDLVVRVSNEKYKKFSKDFSKEDLEKREKALKMSKGIDKRDYYKRIGD